MAAKRTPVAEVSAPTSSSIALDAITEEARMVRMIPLDRVFPHPRNPRRDVGDVTELADSIREHGVQQPVTLVPHPDEAGAFFLLLGHRRAAACAVAGLDAVPALIREGLSDKDQLALMLVENLQRTDLTITEEGDGYQGLLDLGETVNGVATLTGRHAVTVSKRVKVAGLPDPVRARVDEHQLTIEDALLLLELEDMDAALFASTVKRLADGKTGDAKRDVTDAHAKATLQLLINTLTEEWADKGHRLVFGNEYYSAIALQYLDLTSEEHANCPGAIVHLWNAWGLSTEKIASQGVFRCTDAEQYHPGAEAAHRERLRGENVSRPTPEMTPMQQLREDFARAAEEAAQARTKWLMGTLTGTTQKHFSFRGAVDDFALKMLRRGDTLKLSIDADWADVDFPTDGAVMVAVLAAAIDDKVPLYYNEWAYDTGHGPDVTYRWLTLLETHGYTLHPVERTWRALGQSLTDATATDPKIRIDITAVQVLREFCTQAERDVPEELQPAAAVDSDADPDEDDEYFEDDEFDEDDE